LQWFLFQFFLCHSISFRMECIFFDVFSMFFCGLQTSKIHVKIPKGRSHSMQNCFKWTVWWNIEIFNSRELLMVWSQTSQFTVTFKNLVFGLFWTSRITTPIPRIFWPPLSSPSYYQSVLWILSTALITRLEAWTKILHKASAALKMGLLSQGPKRVELPELRQQKQHTSRTADHQHQITYIFNRSVVFNRAIFIQGECEKIWKEQSTFHC